MSKYIESIWKQLPIDEAKKLKEFASNLPKTQMKFAVLDPDGGVHECDLLTSIVWRQVNPNGCNIASEKIDGHTISTVFLGFDHGQNYYFETMVFPKEGTPDCGYSLSVRSKTFNEARANHLRVCAKVFAIANTDPTLRNYLSN